MLSNSVQFKYNAQLKIVFICMNKDVDSKNIGKTLNVKYFHKVNYFYIVVFQ